MENNTPILISIDALYNHYEKNWTKLTKELGLGVNTYQNWLRKGYIPYSTQTKIQEKTNGVFIANIQK
jgi:hypothetical protein